MRLLMSAVARRRAASEEVEPMRKVITYELTGVFEDEKTIKLDCRVLIPPKRDGEGPGDDPRGS
jgi:hypothetical protein